jgi:hypothetical protein
MNKKNFILIAVVLAMVGVYIAFFTDWFQPKVIQLSHTSRPMMNRLGQTSTALTFGLGDYYELTDVKVVPFAEWQSDKNVQPLWHLISDGSDSINRFTYGERIPGMDPAVEGMRPEPLKPGVEYLLLVAAGKAKGQHPFHVGSLPTGVSTNK